jgi:hypothetical protein
MNASTNAVAVVNSLNTRALLRKDGEVRGTRYTFGGTETPSELRKRLKESGLKGNKLSTAVREVQMGKLHASFVETQAFVEYMRKEGFIPAGGQITARAGKIDFVKMTGGAKTAKTESQIREAAVADILAKLRALGLDEATLASL